MDKSYIIKSFWRFKRGGKRRTSQRLFVGKQEEARAVATKIRNTLVQDGCTDVRVEIWQVIATSYTGTIREVAQ